MNNVRFLKLSIFYFLFNLSVFDIRMYYNIIIKIKIIIFF